MVFLKAKPNVSDHEKARIEFHLQQIADCVGFQPLQLGFISPEAFLKSPSTLPDLIKQVAAHLSHDITDLQVLTLPKKVEKCGGGG